MVLKESTSLKLYLFIVATIFIVNYIIHLIYPSVKASDLIFWWSGQCVITVFLLGYVLHSWKSDISEFLKRIRVTIPFALVFLIFIRITGHGSLRSIFAGLFVCILLLFKTPNWKRHFTAILIPVIISVILLKFLVIPLHNLDMPAEGSFLMTTFYVACFVPIVSFLSLYMSKLEPAETPHLKPILVRTIKFTIASEIFFATFLVLDDIGNKKGLSLSFQLVINSLLAICFLVICYVFDLSLIERKKKKNRSSELQKELNDFYLEQQAKRKN